MPSRINYNDPGYAQSVAEILRRQNNAEPEASITSAVRDFVVTAGLVKASCIASRFLLAMPYIRLRGDDPDHPPAILMY